MAEAKKKAPLTDSEGLRVASVQDDVVEEEPKKTPAKEAFEAEVAATNDAEDASKTEAFDKFLSER